ncbi:hypothetical protein SAMN05192544_1001425 [Paraburkholderia hospita]|nr:hypothetical protein SAMN05192544_1001425 [Paraburkholderia hospita]
MHIKGPWRTAAAKRMFAVRRFRSQRPVGNLDAFFRHPFTLLIAGFLLTTVIGSYFAHFRDQRDTAETRRTVQAAYYQRTLEQFSRSISEWDARATLLYDAVFHDRPAEELRTLKYKYDEAYISIVANSYATIELENELQTGSLVFVEALDSLQGTIASTNQCVNGIYETYSKDRHDQPANACGEQPRYAGGVQQDSFNLLIVKSRACAQNIALLLRPRGADGRSLAQKMFSPNDADLTWLRQNEVSSDWTEYNIGELARNCRLTADQEHNALIAAAKANPAPEPNARLALSK